MSKKCRAYSESKLGLEPPNNRKAFYEGWDAARLELLAIKDELVNALKLIAAQDQGCGGNVTEAEEWRSSQRIARAALAKAEGGEVEAFCPATLEAERNAKRLTVDYGLIEWTKETITSANQAGKRIVLVQYKTTQKWETTKKYFEDLGFSFRNYGRDGVRDFDQDGDEVYLFHIGW